jgi:hypothetical protein
MLSRVQQPVTGPPLPDVAGRVSEVRLRKDLAVFVEFFRLSAFVSHTASGIAAGSRRPALLQSPEGG